MTTAGEAQDPDAAEPSPGGPAPHLAALYACHHGRLRRHAETRLPSHLRHEADVALMAVFAKLVRASADGSLTQPGSWEAYLVAAVSNACVDLVRAERHDVSLDKDSPDLAELDRDAPRDPTADHAVARDEETRAIVRVTAALDNLEPRLRTIVIGKIWDTRSDRDLGRELEITGQRVGQPVQAGPTTTTGGGEARR